ncbi:zinc transport system substrate-binding protein [Shimia gijangensis]|uniref:High-affinity zinc uptake system protein ZnuA n=1 Tax=Shimia gijangensis TaxID=1470563 RepID=A0A1M6NSH3_9RHOB|nr:zinc transport system substrate-binding protein [Shimia gijangensis]
MNRLLSGVTAALLLSGGALAEGVRVVVDVAPIHSMVARVMQNVAEPTLLIRAGDSPHDFALRPSAAQSLQDVDVVFWLGHMLTPSLEDTLATVATHAQSVELSEVPGTTVLEFRQEAVFGEDHHDDEHEDAHDDHHDDHAHEGVDPHMWLDPDNAAIWLTEIADTLQKADPKNADIYAANAAVAKSEYSELSLEIDALLSPLKAEQFVVFHDAYQYFENRFHLEATGAIVLSDGRAPSAARLNEVRDEIMHQGVTCVFSEPQFDPRMVQAVAGMANTAELDPMGVEITSGPDLYPTLIRNLAMAISSCLRNH